MYTLTLDLHNHYRIWVEGGLLRVERKTTAMGKEAIGEVVAFSATNHTYWRLRHDTVWDDIVFETAPKVSGAPGAWTPWPVIADRGPPSGRGIPAGSVAPRSNTSGILGRRALPAGRRAPESGPRSAKTDHWQARTPRTIPITAIKLEMKGGTYQSEGTAPGSVAFDSVQVVR